MSEELESNKKFDYSFREKEETCSNRDSLFLI